MELSSYASALHPGLSRLREQLSGLMTGAAEAAPAAARQARPALLQQAMDNAPLLLELGTTLLHRMRGGREEAIARPAPPPPRRFRVLRPILIAAAVAGAAYYAGRAYAPAGRSRAARQA